MDHLKSTQNGAYKSHVSTDLRKELNEFNLDSIFLSDFCSSHDPK